MLTRKLEVIYSNGKSYHVSGVTHWSPVKRKSGLFDVQYVRSKEDKNSFTNTLHETKTSDVIAVKESYRKDGVKTTAFHELGA